jgi:hypothetical protein
LRDNFETLAQAKEAVRRRKKQARNRKTRRKKPVLHPLISFVGRISPLHLPKATPKKKKKKHK